LGGLDLARRRDHEANAAVDSRAAGVLCGLAGRVGDGDQQHVALEAERDRPTGSRYPLGHERDSIRAHVDLGEVDELEPFLLGQERPEVALADQAAREQDLTEAPAGLPSLDESVPQVVGTDEVVAQEQAPEREVAKSFGRAFHALNIVRNGQDGNRPKERIAEGPPFG
jgi:hypothetical protein